MISKHKLDKFTLQYNLNNDISKEWDEKIYQLSDKNTWMNILKNRATIMQKIFHNNEQMIQDTLFPIINNKHKFKDFEYDTLFDWLKDFYNNGEDDPFLVLEFIEIVLPYYELMKHNKKLLFLYYYKANILLKISYAGANDTFECAISYFYKVIDFRKLYNTFCQSSDRIFIFKAYYHLLDVIFKNKLTASYDIHVIWKSLEKLLNHEYIKNKDNKNNQISTIVEKTHHLYKNISYKQLIEENPHQTALPAFYTALKKEFQRQVLRFGSINQGDPMLVSSYYMALASSCHISWNQCWWVLEQYYYKKLNMFSFLKDEDISGIITLQIYFPIYLTDCLNKSTLPVAWKNEKARRYRMSVLDNFKHHTTNTDLYMVNQSLCHFCFHPAILKGILTKEEKEDFLFHFIATRHIDTCIHSIMVAKFAECILEEIINNHASMLIGIRQCATILDVKNKKEQILNFVKKAGLFHDIGKYGLINVVNTQYRGITDLEFEIIQSHPLKGYEYLNSDADLAEYCDVALGHHTSYDCKTGYPSSANNSHSQIKLIIDLISICDCIDAATDAYGRNYHNAKTFSYVFQELKEHSGTLYHPFIMNLIEKSSTLFLKLESITIKDREEIYYDTCKKFLHE